MAYLDAVETQRLLASDEMEEKVMALEDFKHWALIEDTYWRQRLGRFGSKKGIGMLGFSIE